MKYIFMCACVLMIIILLIRKKIDFFCVAAVFLMIYNFHCVYGVVFISSHEHAGEYYYYSKILPQVYFIVIAQMVLLAIYMLMNDSREKRDAENTIKYESFLVDTFDEESKYKLFKYLCIIAWAIMLYNVFFKITLSYITAEKGLVWKRIGGSYTLCNWMGMATFSYGIKNKKYLLSLFSSAPVLLHFFIGSRAYMTVLILIIIINHSQSIGQSMIKHWKVIFGGAFAGIFILAYKKVYELIKLKEFAAAFNVLLDPETYSFVARLGEPRIILADLNYIIDNNIHLGIRAVWDRLIEIFPFASNIFDSHYNAVSSILREGMLSSYGLGSNIWGEYYAIGSYFGLFIMFFIWLRMLSWGNKCLQRTDYSAYFIIPVLVYISFYVHRQDFVKIVGYAKGALLALGVFVLMGMITSRQGMKIYCRLRR